MEGALFLAAFVASCFLGAFPPVDLRAVCLVRAISHYSNNKNIYIKAPPHVFDRKPTRVTRGTAELKQVKKSSHPCIKLDQLREQTLLRYCCQIQRLPSPRPTHKCTTGRRLVFKRAPATPRLPPARPRLSNINLAGMNGFQIITLVFNKPRLHF